MNASFTHLPLETSLPVWFIYVKHVESIHPKSNSNFPWDS